MFHLSIEFYASEDSTICLMQLRPLSSFGFITNTKEFVYLFSFYIRVEALYTLKHHSAESVTSDFFIADPKEGKEDDETRFSPLPGSSL